MNAPNQSESNKSDLHLSKDIFQDTFRALADPTRRDILQLLSNQDMTIGEVSQHFTITRAAVKKHLTVLQQGHLISVHASGRERINRLEPLVLKSIVDWLNHFSHFWDERLSDLKTAVEREAKISNPKQGS